MPHFGPAKAGTPTLKSAVDRALHGHYEISGAAVDGRASWTMPHQVCQVRDPTPPEIVQIGKGYRTFASSCRLVAEVPGIGFRAGDVPFFAWASPMGITYEQIDNTPAETRTRTRPARSQN